MLQIVSHPFIVMGAAGFCAIPCFDTATCSILNLVSLVSKGPFDFPKPNENNDEKIERENFKRKRLSQIKAEFIHHAILSLFLGACASNLVIGSPLIGALGFVIYSKQTWKKESRKSPRSYSLIACGLSLDLLFHYKKQIVKSVWHGIRKISTATGKLVAKTLNKIGILFRAIFRGLKNTAKMLSRLTKACGAIFKVLFRFPKLTASLVLGGGALTAIWILTPNGTAAMAGVVTKSFFIGVWKGVEVIPQMIKICFSALAYGISYSAGPMCKGIGFAATKLGTALLYIPSTIYHVLKVIVNIARFLLRI